MPTIPTDLMPTKLPSPAPRPLDDDAGILHFHGQIARVGRTMSPGELAEHILEELQRVGDVPHVTELALCAQYANQADLTVTFKGEWEVGTKTETQVVTSEIERRFLQGLRNAITIRAAFEAQALTTRLSEAAAASEDDAIDLVYKHLHQLIERSEFEIIDEFLHTLIVETQVNSVLLSILTITALFEVEAKLRWRQNFYDRVKEWFVKREGDQIAEELLVGLG